jgi:hypothetical protein
MAQQLRQRAATVRALYRDLVQAAQLVEPRETSADMVRSIRQSFRQHLHETDQAKLDELVAEGCERLSYVRTVVPLMNRRMLRRRNTNVGGRYVVSTDGMVVQRAAKANKKTKWDHDHGIDPEDLARHEYLLRRQHFLEKPPLEVMEKIYRGE